MLTLRESVFDELRKAADQRGVTIQGLIRAVIVPEWHLDHNLTLDTRATASSALDIDRSMKQIESRDSWPNSRGQAENSVPRKIIRQN
jgi:hypothetical protein